MLSAIAGSLYHAVSARTAAFVQDTGIHVADTSQVDTAVVKSPMPRGVSTVLRFMFNLPAWFQIAGAVLGVIVGIVVLVLIWRHRQRIVTWVTTRSNGWKVGLGVTAGFVVLLAGAFGFAGFHYMEHDNNFCVSCHVMTPAFTRFQQSQHSKLECHQCHRQSMFANARQLYYWIAERPDKIKAHAPVPTRVCNECHMQQQAGDSTWKRILATGGHAMHLRNDKEKLKNVQCVTCHGAEVHQFKPVDKTCAQSNCHDDVKIKLGKMASQTSMHCAGCHDFGRKTAEGVSPDSARLATIPVADNCFGCHQMREKLADFSPAREPHKAVCGTCHDPHKQEDPKDSWKTCQNSGCHTKPDTLTPFHRGIAAKTLSDCGMCHKAHTWRVQGGQCQSCHKGAFTTHPKMQKLEASIPAKHGEEGAATGTPAAGGTATPAAPAAGATAPNDAGVTPAPVGATPTPGGGPDDWVSPPGRRPHGPMPDLSEPPAQGTTPAPAVQRDTAKFSHERHASLTCHACHRPGEAHGRLVVRTKQDCQSCHHSTAQRTACSTCHAPSEIAATYSTKLQMRATVWQGARDRELPFRHALHEKLECRSCHTGGADLTPKKTCTSCHEQHHQPAANCKSCHTGGAVGHPREATHQSCTGAGCHQDPPIVALEPTRNVCLTCHVKQVDHKPGGDCATCHLVPWHAAARAVSRGGTQP